MRFILHNPHVEIWYLTPLYHIFTRRKSVKKYIHIIDYLLKGNNDCYVYVDSIGSSFPGNKIRKFIPPIIEFYLWCLLNKVNPFKFKVLTKISQLSNDDVLFSFLYGNFTTNNAKFDVIPDLVIRNFKNIISLKVVHLTHYMYNIELGSQNAALANIDLFVAENNLFRNSAFFRHFYSWYHKDVYVLPFVPKERFKKYVEFSLRKNKAVATGTLTFLMGDKNFIDFFHSPQVHPIRNEIYTNKEALKPFIDSYISDIKEGKEIKINKAKSKIKKILTRLYNDFFVKQKKYFSFDIVEKYNDYKMFIVPEEINDLPGIGFVEGMACGAAYIGQKNRMYEDLGLCDKVHYIGYDGTMNDLIDKIKYYQTNIKELEVIAQNGYNFVMENFNKEIVIKNFINFLEKMIINRKYPEKSI